MALITLSSCDGLSKEVSYETACCSQVLKVAIEAYEGIENKDIIIPLSEVKGVVLKEVIQWCEKHHSCLSSTNNSSQGIDGIIIAKGSGKPMLPADIHKLFEIIQAANYLEIEGLLNIGCQTAASLIPDMFSNWNRCPTLQEELLGLPTELFDMVLKQLPRYEYLKYVARLPNEPFAKKIEQELTIEMGNLESTENSTANDLRYIVEGWNTETGNAKYDIHHCKIPKISSVPRWHQNNWAAPTLITDGLYILLGSGFEESSTSLVIFDIVNAKKRFIQATELNERGWPSDPEQQISAMAFHSGLIIIHVLGEGLRCFELSASTLRITRLHPQQDFLSICSDSSQIAINKELICILKYSDNSKYILVFSRGFVLKGRIKTPRYISQLYIRGRTIIAADRTHSIETWQVKDTSDLETSVAHFRSVLISETNRFQPHKDIDLGLSHNLDTFFATDDIHFYCDNKLIAEFIPLVEWNPIGFPKRSFPRLGCLDMLAAQYFAVYRFESTKDRITIRFEISNSRFLEKVKRVSIWVPKGDLGEFLGCNMYFTTIVLFFSSGIARLRLEDYESIYERVALNSSSLIVQTRGLEERKDLPEDNDSEEYINLSEVRH